MAVRRADLGPASAWAEAVAEGYTGSREDWARALASASTAAQRVEDAAEIVARAVDVDSALQQVDAGLQMVTTWTTGAQMINPAGVVFGKLNSAGTAIGTEATMETTGWIPVQALQEYKVGRWGSGRWGTGTDYVNRWAAYTERDLSTVIGTASSTACTEFTTPEGAAFVRFSYKASYTGLLMAPAESFPEEWEDYGRQYSYAAGIATQAELETAEQLLMDGIAGEETARQAADADLQDDIDGEAATRAAAVSAVVSQLETESNTRDAADQSIRGLIAEDFDEFETYSAGEYCIGPGGHLYLFTAEHTGEWSAADADDVGDVGARFHGYDTALTYLGGTLDTTTGQVQQLNTRVPLPGQLSNGVYYLAVGIDSQGGKSYGWELPAGTQVLNEEDGTADLDITDSYGNVLARFEGGRFQTKKFRGFDYVTYSSPSASYTGAALTLTCPQTFAKGDRVVIHCERGAMPWNGGAAVTYYEGTTAIKSSWRGDCAYLEHTIRTDGAQIKAVYAASAAGMTVGAVQLQVSLLGDLPIKPTVVTVKQDGSGDYTTIRGALDAIGTQASEPLHPYRIEVYPGTYNVMSDYSDTEISAAAYDQTSFVGPKLLDGMHMVGMGLPQEVVVSGTLDTSVWSSSIRGVVSTLNFQGNCSIENLTIAAENLRYCIHDDFHYPIGQIRRISMVNCVFKASGSMSYAVPVTYGAGARDGGVLLYAENCDFGPVFSIHTAQSTNNNSRYYLRNCKGSQADFGDIVTSSDTSKQNQVVFDSCDFLQVHVDNWQVSAENYQPHVQVFGTLATSPMYQMLPSVLYDTSDVTHSIPLTLDVGTAVEMYIVTSDKQSLRWKKATAVSKVGGVIVFKDSETTYIQHRGYVRTDRLGLASFAVGDLIGMDSDGAATVVQSDADAYGKIVMVDADGFGYVRLKGE